MSDIASPAARPPSRGEAAAFGAAERARILPRLVPVGPEDLADLGRGGRARVLRLLVRALRSERVRGRDGHWSYSLDRHVALVGALAAERRGWVEAFGERWPGWTPGAASATAAGAAATSECENANRRGSVDPRRP